MEQHQLSSDGATLALRVYTPAGPPRASVVIGGAMGCARPSTRPLPPGLRARAIG